MSRNTVYRTFNLTTLQLEKLERVADRRGSNVNAVMRGLIDDMPDVRKRRAPASKHPKTAAKPRRAASSAR